MEPSGKDAPTEEGPASSCSPRWNKVMEEDGKEPEAQRLESQRARGGEEEVYITFRTGEDCHAC